MKNLSLLVVLVLGLAGCNLKEKYARNNAAADSWLAANRGAAGTNITGAWEAHDSGWGSIRFEQSGSRITGAMGNYSVRGVVSGSRVFLTLHSDGWVYYTATLRKSGTLLTGFYSSSVPFIADDQSALTLRWLGN